MDTQDGDFCISGSGGTPEDQKFDALVGVIEEFMVTYDLGAVRRTLPPYNAGLDDHARHQVYSAFVAAVERDLEAHVMRHNPGYASMSEIAEVLQARKDEIDEDVFDFVTDGCFEYEGFLAWWQE